MISLDQVMLLAKKVESAVEKIQQLQAENDALRKQCSELTNALSSKSEQLTSFETDQSQIESGILKALDRLNQIENSVLKVAGQAASPAPQVNLQPAAQVQPAKPIQTQPQAAAATTAQTQAPVQPAPVEQKVLQTQFETTPQTQEAVTPQGLNSQFIQTSSQHNVQNNFYTMNDLPSQPETFSEAEPEPEEENSDNLGFDIF